MAAPTSYFETSPTDGPFLEKINAAYPEPSNLPFLFYFYAGKAFYKLLKAVPAETLAAQSWKVIDAYKKAFQSRYSLDDLETSSEVSVVLLPGAYLTVIFTLPAHSLMIELEHYKLKVQQGPYSVLLTFDEQSGDLVRLDFP